MEEGNSGCCANSVDGDRSGNDMGIDDVSVMRPKLKVNWTMNCVTILEELCQKFDIGVPRYFQSTKEGSTHRLELQLYHVLPNLTVSRFSVFGSGGTGKEAKSDAARNLMLEIKKTTREGRNLISGVPKEEFVACCEWMEKYATLNEERPKPSFKWTKGFDATPNEELPLQSEDKIAADLLDTWLSFMRPGVFPTYQVLASPVPGRQTYRMSCKLNRHVTEGIGRTEVIAKNIAARLMLNILESAEGDNRDDNDLP